MVQIALTNFARRNWESESSSTRIEGLSQEELVAQCNQALAAGVELVPGYAPFCTHLFVKNTSPTRCAFAAITEQNRHLLQSGYRARREGELAVLERWFEGLDAPIAGYFDVILYSHAQLVKEAAGFPEEEADVPECDWGIVSIIGTLTPTEPPMPPITQLRNALGTAEGGSGAPIDATKYAAAVVFWDHHAPVK